MSAATSGPTGRPPPPPDFDLAELRQFDPRILAPMPGDVRSERELKELTLILAVVFNDTKLLVWTFDQMKKGVAPAGVDAVQGQIAGWQLQLRRLLAGHLHELMNTLQRYPATLNCAALRKVVLGLHPDARLAWNTLVQVARGKKPHTELGRYLHEMRNGLAFHYAGNGAEWLSAYGRFFSGAKTANSQAAFVSLGDTMEATRFFFADAALMEAERDVLAKHGFDANVYNRIGSTVNQGLRMVVEGLIEHLGHGKPQKYRP